MTNRNLYSEGMALRSFKLKVLTTCIKAEPQHKDQMKDVLQKIKNSGFSSRTIVMISVVIKEGGIKKAEGEIRRSFALLLNLN